MLDAIGIVALEESAGYALSPPEMLVHVDPVERPRAVAIFFVGPADVERRDRAAGVVGHPKEDRPRAREAAAGEEPDGLVATGRGGAVDEQVGTPRAGCSQRAATDRARVLGGRGERAARPGGGCAGCKYPSGREGRGGGVRHAVERLRVRSAGQREGGRGGRRRVPPRREPRSKKDREAATAGITHRRVVLFSKTGCQATPRRRALATSVAVVL